MLEIATDTDTLGIHIQGRPRRPGVRIAEGDSLVDPGTDGLDAGPAVRNRAEELSRGIREQIDLAETARHQVSEHLGRQLLDRDLARVRLDGIRVTRVADQRGVRQGNRPGRRQEPRAEVAERVHILLGGDGRVDLHAVRLLQIMTPVGVHVQNGDHGHRLGDVKADVVTKSDQHGSCTISSRYRRRPA